MRLLPSIVASLAILAACSTPVPSGPKASPGPGSSASPSTGATASPGTTVAGSSAVTLTPESYSTYLGCMNEKHPGQGYLSIQQLVKAGIYSQNWAAYKQQADLAVKINSDTYGKECDA